jgi:transposase
MKKTKELIRELRNENKSYYEISKILKISKATISYHCKRLDMNDPVIEVTNLTNDEILKLKDYYKSHTKKETAKQFNVSDSTVWKYSDRKMITYSDDEKKSRNYARTKTWRQKMKEKAVEYLGGKCIVCGYNKCVWALEFHHRDPNEKDFGISQYDSLNWDVIRIELDKCDLLCSNCHKEHHHNILNKSLPDIAG